ncbi:hypothetical protein ACJ65_06065 [Kocuria rhizophila]|nr:hypothetical protein ACJ65_06065 [Kocuria rhizophila]
MGRASATAYTGVRAPSSPTIPRPKPTQSASSTAMTTMTTGKPRENADPGLDGTADGRSGELMDPS